MNFTDAVNKSRRTNMPIKRKTQSVYGFIEHYNRGIYKYVGGDIRYFVDLEDIIANDWEVKATPPIIELDDKVRLVSGVVVIVADIVGYIVDSAGDTHRVRDIVEVIKGD